jgi:hypothetical protein
MAATTGQLGFVTPTQGTLTGTWGDTVNNGITEYTNIAIAGTLTLTGDGAVTLANTTGDNSASNITSTLTGAGTVTAQFAIVKVTGTLTTAKIITGPRYSKTYTVVNAATGGIVTFKASGQTGVSVAVGESAFVYFNGTDYVKLVGTATAGAAGGSTTQVQYNSSGVLAGSANLTFNGTTLTANTLNLTNALGIAYGGTGQITANAAFNALVPSQTGNSGKYLTTNGTDTSWGTNPLGTVTSVDVSGGTTGLTTSGGPITTSGTITLAGTLATTNGGTNLTSFTSGGVVYASSTSALATSSGLIFNGTNMGLGGTPSAWGSPFGSGAGPVLEMKNVSIATQTTNPLFYMQSNAYYNGTNWIYKTSTYAVQYHQDATPGQGNHKWFIAESGTAGNTVSFTQHMTLNTTGLGIGTTSPAYKLDVQSTGSNTASFARPTGQSIVKIQGISGNSVLSFGDGATIGATSLWALGRKNSDNSFRINYNEDSLDTTNYVTLKTDGNFGIGTTSPSYKLSIAGNSATSSNILLTHNTDATGAYSRIRFQFAEGNTNISSEIRSIQNVVGGNGTNLAFFTENTSAVVTERLRLDPAGNMGLGVTPSAWATVVPAFQIGGAGGYIAAQGSSEVLRIGSNNYFNASFKYVINGFASRYEQTSGTHLWYTAASGTAGNVITFTQAMTLDASGNLMVGTTSAIRSGLVSLAGSSSTVNQLVLADTNAYNASPAPQQNFAIKYTSGGAYCDAAYIKAAKVNTTDANQLAYLAFATNTGSGAVEAARIDSSGNLLVGGTAARGTTVGTKHLDLFDGTAPAGTLTNGVSLYSSSGDLKFMDSAGNAYGVGYRNVPQSGSSKTASYTLATTDVGEYILLGASGAIVIPDATFAAGDVITIFNNTASTATLTCSITTAYIAGTFTDKATMTLAAAGVATVLFITSTLCVVSGNVT